MCCGVQWQLRRHDQRHVLRVDVGRCSQEASIRFVSGLLELRLGDGQPIPFVFEISLFIVSVLFLIAFPQRGIDQCHVGGTLLIIVGNGL